MARGPMALAAAWSLAACGALPDSDDTPLRAVHADTGLLDMSDSSPDFIVAGERLNVGLLRQFYARHDFETVWTSRPAKADALVSAVLRARDHGLDPNLFHASLLQRRSSFPPLRRELLLSSAFLSYTKALASGAVPVDRRRDAEALTPGSVDVAAALDAVIGSSDPAAAIAALAPSTPSYQALREALRQHRANAPAGANVVTDRMRAIEVNLERERWLPRTLPADRVWVNVADQRLDLYQAGRPVFSTRVIVGDDAQHKQSPEFRATIEASFFNPPWVIPRDIVTAEILARIGRDPDYLARNNMVMRPNGEVEQQAGPNSALGLIMFDMPNRFDVYLHDTPDKQLFNRDNRRISHGCIRVQNPLEFAALLMLRPIETINQGIAAGGTTRNALPRPVPVFVAYQTAFADSGGSLEYRPDFYGRDAEIWRLLQRRPQAANSPPRPGTRPASREAGV